MLTYFEGLAVRSHSSSSRSLIFGRVLVAFSIVITSLSVVGYASAASQFYTVHSFEGRNGGDGSIPSGPLVFGGGGVLYGATLYGGQGYGAVFMLKPPATGKGAWTETLIHQFGRDDQQPMGGLIVDKFRVLYGTTSGGPVSNGTVFRLRPPLKGTTTWRYELLHSFQGRNDGAAPEAGLAMNSTGAFFGTTVAGGGGAECGVGGCGTVFELYPPAQGQTAWTETLLHIFSNTNGDGTYPHAGLIFDSSGALYGTTLSGGGSACGGCGTVFKLTPPAQGQTSWTETILYSFQGGLDGQYPTTNLSMDAAGTLYGTTEEGGAKCIPRTGHVCGVVFKLAPPAPGQTTWTESVLYRFMGGDRGFFPSSGVIVDRFGALYGETSAGGGTLCQIGRYRYGTGCGMVFKLTPPAAGHTAWTETVLHGFSGGGKYKRDGDGSAPHGGLIVGKPIPTKPGALFGVTSGGGFKSNYGTVFEIVP